MARRSFRFASATPFSSIIHVSPYNGDWRVVRTTCGAREFFRVQFRGQHWIEQPSKVAAVYFSDRMAETPASAHSVRDRERMVHLTRLTQKYSSEKL